MDYWVLLGIMGDYLGFLLISWDYFVPLGDYWGLPGITGAYQGLLRITWDYI